MFAVFTLPKDDKEVHVGPVPLAENQEPFQMFQVLQNSYSLSVAGKLGVVSVGEVSTSVGSAALVYEAMGYSERIVETPIDDFVYGTRWGAGVRLALKVSDIKGDLKLNIGAVAAQAEMNLVNVEYQLNVLGIRDPTILKLVPKPGQFNFDSYRQILDATAAVRDFMADSANAKSLTPVPFQVFLRIAPITDPFDSAHQTLQAIRNIASGRTYNEARRDFLLHAHRESYLSAAYEKFVSTANPDERPTRDERNRAGDWIEGA